VPFLRVIRDKRGYETTYLMHWYRDGSRQRSRILYVFRTPGGVRVGRHALEPEVLRQIEREYPDIEFDWPVVVENQQVVEASLEARRPRRRQREEEGESPAAKAPAIVPPRPEAAVPSVTPPRPAVPAALSGATPDEQIAFLTEWYPKIRERIEQRTLDAPRREALLALAERLNTAGWTDADQITTGLQQAAEALERLSRVLARRRRRSRKPRGAGDAAPAAESAHDGDAEGPPPRDDSSSAPDA
jgi:hypothetical protein